MSNFELLDLLPRLIFCVFLIKKTTSSRSAHHLHFLFITGFRSVVVITSALHAEGRRFEPGRKQMIFSLWPYNLLPKCNKFFEKLEVCKEQKQNEEKKFLMHSTERRFRSVCLLIPKVNYRTVHLEKLFS